MGGVIGWRRGGVQRAACQETGQVVFGGRMAKIGIIGAGIGGLAAAALMARRGHDVQVFDAFDAPRPIGSGLVIQPVGQSVLAEIGALDAALAAGQKITRMSGHEADAGRMVLDVRYDLNDPGNFGLAIHRASLFDALYDAALTEGAKVICAHKAVSATACVIRFEGARMERAFDLVVDASGVNSAMSPLQGRALPYGAIWGNVPWPDDSDLPRDELSQCYQRASRMIGALPIGTPPNTDVPHAAIFWSLPEDSHAQWCAQSLEVWKAEATALWPAFEPFLREVTTHNAMTMARYSHGTLLRPHRRGVAIIGDAAHRASPQLGQGANMALLDAQALCRAMKGNIGSEVLIAYERARRRHVWIYQAMSWAFTPQYQSDSRVLPWLRDRVFMPLSRVPPVPRILSRLVCGDLTAPLGRLTPRDR